MMADGKRMILVASGASGGHLFPALSVAKELTKSVASGRGKREGFDVKVILGGNKFLDVVERTGLPYVRLPAAAFNDRGPLRLAWAVVKLGQGFLKALKLVMREKPVAVFGTGGYATVALMLAAKLRGVPTVIHEQNVLPGRANRFLARIADVVVLTFEDSLKYLPPVKGRVVVGGTPLREEILVAAARATLAAKKSKHFTLVVLGGSQGARILGEVVPEMVAMMPEAERKTLRVVQQVRIDDLARVKNMYDAMGLAEVVVQPFFTDMPTVYAEADLLIGRSGVGTVLECAAFGVPAIYVPLELADGHQKLNAGVAEQVGAAVVVEQSYFTPANLLVHVRAIRGDKARLEAMSAAAHTLARPDATQVVAKVIAEAVR
ncbi:MAG: undecaprenyldiphospho-muramoylpentapeptide beta-N-acetylglucosaminyltransferase [Alphaproteobacteria bacterium]|nr:MAG: undecaprenyldiphospho-muramoylpentapeptide beta-N-acetylglucosaminyltransferase [Alphaproteobacteria bacterium]